MEDPKVSKTPLLLPFKVFVSNGDCKWGRIDIQLHRADTLKEKLLIALVYFPFVKVKNSDDTVIVIDAHNAERQLFYGKIYLPYKKAGEYADIIIGRLYKYERGEEYEKELVIERSEE